MPTITIVDATLLVHALLGRVPSPIFGLSVACLFDWTVVTLVGRLWRLWAPVMLESAVGQSEWSAKRERSERGADHARKQGSGSVRLVAVLTNTG